MKKLSRTNRSANNHACHGSCCARSAPSTVAVDLGRWQNNMKYLSVLFGVLFLSVAAHASDAPSREDRIAKARELQSKLIKIEQYIPNLNPEQASYVTSEREAINRIKDEDAKLSRLVKLEETKEAQIEKIKTTFKYANTALSAIARDDISIDQEIFAWLSFVSYFMNASTLDGSISILERDGVLSPADIQRMGLFKGSFGYGQFLSWNSKSVLDDIVMPLQYQKMKK
jgi:hypothetical protein